jgi:hypothetical protein
MGLSEAEFVREYMGRRRPVVIEGALDGWRAPSRWTPEFLRCEYGGLRVLVQGSTFQPLGVETLGAFLDRIERVEAENRFGREDVPFLRYTRMDDSRTDDLGARILEELSEDWGPLPFLPRNLYVIPRVERGADPSRMRFPSFGLYVSPRGACTSLHVDADKTSAVNCQFRGEKRWFVFEPRLAAELADLRPAPTDLTRRPIPEFGGVVPTHIFTLKPGQVVYLPGDWHHEVYTLSASISLTFNFVHISEAPEWFETGLQGMRDSADGRERLRHVLASLQHILRASIAPEHIEDLVRWGVAPSRLTTLVGHLPNLV